MKNKNIVLHSSIRNNILEGDKLMNSVYSSSRYTSFIENTYLKIKQTDLYSFTEADVENRIILPILTNIFHIPTNYISSKPYIKKTAPSFDINKGSKKQKGYIPDFIIYIDGLPLVIIEAKSPDKNIDDAIEEASLYALELNKKYPTNINPAQFIIGCNGYEFKFGKWDDENNYITVKINEFNPSNNNVISIKKSINFDSLTNNAEERNAQLTTKVSYFSALNLPGSQKKTLTSIEPNPFFGSGILSSIISQYFDSTEEDREQIIDQAYVSTTDRSNFDRELESIIQNRLKLFNTPQQKYNTNHDLENALNKYLDTSLKMKKKPSKLQLIVGPVGSGKSLFMERFYKNILSPQIKNQIIWIKIDFNTLPESKELLEEQICKIFIDQVREVALTQKIDIDENIETIFNKKINENKFIYNKLKKISEKDYLIQLKQDLFSWKEDLHLYVSCIAGYLSSMQKNIVIVFDNVDRLSTDTQIQLFQISQWLTNQTQSLGIMDIRDTTYELFKDRPPLDAFANGNNFYISSPSILQVINKRLDIAAETIRNLSRTTELTALLPCGMTATYNLDSLERYFHAIYALISIGYGKMIINSLSNKSIRNVLNVFSQVIKSGHINVEKFIISSYNSAGKNDTVRISESELIKALMRQNYKYYTNNTTNIIHNIFGSIEQLERNNSFLIILCLLFLSKNFNSTGDNGFKGIFSCNTIVNHLEKYGFLKNDILKVLNTLLKKDLIYSDKSMSEDLDMNDLIQISASGYLHLKFLSTRLEYLASCAFTALIADKDVATRIGKIWFLSEHAKDINLNHKKEAANLLIDSLEKEFILYKNINPHFALDADDIQLLIDRAKEGIAWNNKNLETTDNLLQFPKKESSNFGDIDFVSIDEQ
ncbi:MAG: type I restriction enzyme HsdR N-terminal domain-containing protein [Muribaculaceae bacterium]|nr:type I restriction enzyme HsdR N-terminal domain-containing protein [Muribaculaceae bacterium]